MEVWYAQHGPKIESDLVGQRMAFAFTPVELCVFDVEDPEGKNLWCVTIVSAMYSLADSAVSIGM